MQLGPSHTTVLFTDTGSFCELVLWVPAPSMFHSYHLYPKEEQLFSSELCSECMGESWIRGVFHPVQWGWSGKKTASRDEGGECTFLEVEKGHVKQSQWERPTVWVLPPLKSPSWACDSELHTDPWILMEIYLLKCPLSSSLFKHCFTVNTPPWPWNGNLPFSDSWARNAINPPRVSNFE